MKTNTMESVALYITPLSPVHVGIGEDYEPTNYVMEEQALFAFDSDVANRVLTERQRKDLLDMVSKPTRRAEDMIKQVQDFFYNNRKPLAAASSHFLPVSAGVFDLYQKRVGQSANRESGGKSVVNKLEIQRTFFNPYSQNPVIPGSSIKGAIRTALLDDVNDEEPVGEKKGLHELQGRLFQYRDPKRGKLHLEQDPMRLISVGDANYQTTSLFGSEICFAVNRKKYPVKDSNGNLRQAQGENLSQMLEYLPLRYRSFQGNLNIQNLQGITGQKTPNESLRWKLQYIANACNFFYYKRFETEINVLRERAYLVSEWEKLANAVLSGFIYQKMKAGKAILLRVGRHSGAESVTLSGEGVRSIKIKGEGRNFTNEPEAKTVWLAANTEKDRSGMLPFGWVLVELDDAPDAALQTLLKPWQDKDQQRQEQLQQASGKHSAALQAQQAAMIAESEPELWAGARITFNRANGTLSVEKSGKTVNALKPKGEELLNTLTPAIKQKVMSNQFVKVNAHVLGKVVIRIETT